MTARILLVEDDLDLARGLRFNLEQEGYRVEHTDRGGDALERIAGDEPDLVLLDLNLPDQDGLDVLRRLRADGRRLPVICLTARGQETDVVMGLGVGADDYVTKPFGLAELMARVAVRLRDAAPAEDGPLRLGSALVDLAARTVRHPDREEELTPTEAELLAYLVQRRGRAVERADLLRDLWGMRDTRSTRTLDNHMARLRRKLEADPASPAVLVTVHGTGYRLET